MLLQRVDVIVIASTNCLSCILRLISCVEHDTNIVGDNQIIKHLSFVYFTKILAFTIREAGVAMLQ